MARKGLFIIFLIAILGGSFYFRSLLFPEIPEPDLLDRLPESEYIGKVTIFDLAKESNDLMFYNQFPFRDVLSPDFLLAQAKSYGIDLQKPAYFFANEKEWGIVIELTDSSKIFSGIIRLHNNLPVKDTLVAGQRVTQYPKENMYLTYGNKWLFIYKGKNFPKRMYHVQYSKKGDVSKDWAAFAKESLFKNEKLVVYAKNKTLKKYGIEKALFAHDSDTLNLHFKAYFKFKDSLHITQKLTGKAFERKINSENSINLHLDISKMRSDKNHPLYRFVQDISKRVSFPVATFFDAWEGDLSYHQGGTITVKESYVKTEMDENFNLREVRSEKDVQVAGFSLMLSSNQQQKELISKLFGKGIMRKEGEKYRVLTSPPLRLILKPNVLSFYSYAFMPKVIESTENNGTWNYKGTLWKFNLDSLTSNEVFMSLNVSAKHVLKQSLLAK